LGEGGVRQGHVFVGLVNGKSGRSRIDIKNVYFLLKGGDVEVAQSVAKSQDQKENMRAAKIKKGGWGFKKESGTQAVS